MEAVSEGVYTEELLTHKLAPEQYLSMAVKAAQRLAWPVVGAEGNAVVFHTTANDYFQGELFRVTVDGGKAFAQSQPVNEYYMEEGQSQRNLQLFKQAMAAALHEHELEERNLHPMQREKWGALVPSKTYLVTPLIVYANALVFVAMVIAGLSPLNPTAKELFYWGGNFRPAVADGEWWRLITYMFLHGGIMHLLMNTYALLYIGMFLEPLMGRSRFASAYLLTGVCAGLMSLGMHPFTVCVGASGAIFGMYGIYLALLTTKYIKQSMRRTMLRSLLFFVVFNLIMGLQGNTDNAAHIGGLLAGVAIGYAYYPGIAGKAPMSRQLITTLVIAVSIVCLAAVMWYSFN